MLRHEASSSPCKAAMLVEEDPSCLRMTGFLNYVMGRYEASSSLCIAAMLIEEDPSYLRMTDSFLNHVMGRNKASSSPCIVDMYIEEDSSLPLRMTRIYWLNVISPLELTGF